MCGGDNAGCVRQVGVATTQRDECPAVDMLPSKQLGDPYSSSRMYFAMCCTIVPNTSLYQGASFCAQQPDWSMHRIPFSQA